MDSPSKQPPLSSPISLAGGAAASSRPRTVTNSSTSSQDSESTFTTHAQQQSSSSSSPFVPPRRLYAQPALNASNTSVQSFSRPLPRPVPNESSLSVSRARAASPTESIVGGSSWVPGHRARQRSQGFFDPTISSASNNSSGTNLSMQQGPGLSASQIAAQAAMHVQAQHGNAHNRKRSQTLPDPSHQQQPPPAPGAVGMGMRRPPPVQATPYSNAQQLPGANTMRGYDGFLGGHSLAAATAANAAFPRSPGQTTPSLQPSYSPQLPPDGARPPPVPEKDVKPAGKEKSKMKLFSKPKNIGIYGKSDSDKKLAAALPSPRLGAPQLASNYSSTSINKFANASTTSLVDNTSSASSSFYSSQNASTSTLVPAEREREREKHKHHFLSRQKNKLKDKDDLHLALSSASSTSRPTDPSAPQPLYNFAVPASPGHASTFAKSVSGLDLRHGGRALREKKKEDKDRERLVAQVQQPSALSSTSLLEPPSRDASLPQSSADWPNPSPYSSSSAFGPATGGTAISDYSISQPAVSTLGNSFGIQGMQPDDAWPLLKAKLLNIFEGEDLRPPIEDFNALVSVHLKRCIQRRAPTLIIEDLNELLATGFLSLEQTLRGVPDDRLVPHLVAMWNLVFSVILPFLQAVFLPLDLEFKGRGPIMTPREAADFWGAVLPPSSGGSAADPAEGTEHVPILGEGELDVRRIVLLKFRDAVFLPRHDALMALFTRLSLDSISAGIYPYDPLPEVPSIGGGTRPGTAQSADGIGIGGSYNSLSSNNPLDNSPFSSAAGRSRATSNTSAGSFPSSLGGHSTASHPLLQPIPSQRTQPMDSAQVTEMVGRMLQCVSVLASAQSKDEPQRKMERLVKELKLNWLGRGRTGRQRRGFVGTKRLGVGGVVGVA